MGFKCGIVGLPNVGKSTLFNALTQTAAAQAANYPFCTIEPNVGEIAVPDPRLDKLAVLGKSEQIVPTRITFVDIAGLVRGASKGEGLGNQFLATIREVDAIVHVVRCFEDSDVTHVEGKIDPIADIETIETELMLADLDSLEKRVDDLEKKAKGTGKDAKQAKETLDLVNRVAGAAARGQARAPGRAQARGRKAVPLARPAHVGARALRLQRRGGVCRDRQRILPQGRRARQGRGRGRGRDLGQDRIRDRRRCRADERADYLEAVGLKETGLDRLVRAGYALLAPGDLFHRRPEGGARLDHHPGHQGAAGGRRHPHRFRARLHPRRDHRL